MASREQEHKRRLEFEQVLQRLQHLSPRVDASDQKPDTGGTPLTLKHIDDMLDDLKSLQPMPPLKDQLLQQLQADIERRAVFTGQQAAYADEEGHFDEWTEPLEEWDGKLCMTCGASWACEHT